MNTINRDIFKAIHEGKWLKIEYRNRSGEVTKYWIGIRDMNLKKRALKVDGLHLSKYTVAQYDTVYIDSILSTQIIEGSYCPVNEELVRDISENPHKYKLLFENTANLKILNYLEMCNRLDAVPYCSDFRLVRFIDRDSFSEGCYPLSEEQFREIVKQFQYKADRDAVSEGKLLIRQLAMNVLSIHTDRGLYVLAYRRLHLDVKKRVLRPEEDITICTEFTIDGKTESIRYYLDAEEYELLHDFERHQEKIKDCVAKRTNRAVCVDDMPYVIGIGMDVILDLHKEYNAILTMYQENTVTFPIRAFFGDLLERPRRRKAYPIAFLNQEMNLDQLLAIHNAMKYPVAYIQGPPGTGKTNTIINTIITAFFNERTVLFASYNNVPIDGVFEKLASLTYHGEKIPFPVLRLGNGQKIKEAISYIKELYERTEGIRVFEATLDRRKDDRVRRARKLSDLLKNYEERLDLTERSETLKRLLEYQQQAGNKIKLLPFQADLQGRQLEQVNRKIEEMGDVTDGDARALLDHNEEEFYQFLFYSSAGYIKRLGSGRYADFMEILYDTDEKKQMEAFHKYFSKTENVRKMQKVFPIMITTCISAHKIGEPKPMFDMTILDEASQCNTAVSLVPIIRGENLMLVGDPQQLNPVILLDELTNRKLRRKYRVAEEYDYRTNSVYKTYLACDAVSDEVLLRNHYRCHEKIIEFNNKKYYNSKLNICSSRKESRPLFYFDVQGECGDAKNTAPAEVREIIRIAGENREKSIGVITPFVNQRKLIEAALEKENLGNVVCGTVHAFQGDEKDMVLFSTAVTEHTHAGTYEWLKNNKELINVATSRARDRLIVLSNSQNLERLHKSGEEDDFYELVEYVRNNGESEVSSKQVNSRALGIKPFRAETEEAFLKNLNHALENIWLSESSFTIERQVAVSDIFREKSGGEDLFYRDCFDFVVYEKQPGREVPILAIELDGKEHFEDEIVQVRDVRKRELCREQDLQMIRVENSYARRYHHMKEILLDYFSKRH